eukprot:583375_1
MIHMIVLYELPPRRTLIYNPSTCLWCHSCNAQTFVEGCKFTVFKSVVIIHCFHIFGATLGRICTGKIDFERSPHTAFQVVLLVVIGVNDYDSRRVSAPLKVV